MSVVTDPSPSATAHPLTKPPVFVLVHGAWHGGWCWQHVSAYLRAAGALVYTPTLSGLGEHKGNLTAAIDLDTHIADIVNLLHMEDLHDVVLVGHSYGGLVITGVADRAPARLRKLLFLDSLLAKHGQSLVSLQPEAGQEALRQMAAPSDGLLLPALPAFPAAYFGVTEPALSRWVEERLTPQPYRTLTQPLVLTQPFGNHLPLVYIECDTPPLDVIQPFVARTKASEAWQNYTLHEAHSAMLTAPRQLADLLELLSH
jgi:pimeloyl-ACP methyl ester carboxylesterase